MFTISTPKTEQELSDYFHFRWKWLREQWGFPEGSEKDEYETVSEHRVILSPSGDIAACGRMHLNTADEAQFRHIAVDKKYRRKGVGQLILGALEMVARDLGAKRAVTNSRETSMSFFSSCGFSIEKEAPLELGKLKRKHMFKLLVDNNVLVLHPQWCKELQDTWHEKIPITEHMGITLYQYTERTIETRASLNKNINLHGSMFAGSIFSQATLTGWGMIFLQLKQKELLGEIVLGEANIQYHRPITKRPRAICNIESVTARFDLLKANKKCPVELKVDIHDDDTPVATFTAKYWVLPPNNETKT